MAVLSHWSNVISLSPLPQDAVHCLGQHLEPSRATERTKLWKILNLTRSLMRQFQHQLRNVHSSKLCECGKETQFTVGSYRCASISRAILMRFCHSQNLDKKLGISTFKFNQNLDRNSAPSPSHKQL
ncbi:uncharacterized protein LOC119649862 [Hermetia illucens]|uniref:uncharacterized protein LOC119649862 n=1 Tax=Hermetia illucens TaxID=343691 RepID=UPI0018CC1D66|nr:uncharacterized protein LOC119649862 [Hermetia illucens]